MMMLSKDEFLEKYGQQSEFEKSGLDWETLLAIDSDYQQKESTFREIAIKLVGQISSFPNVHSVSYRLKDPEHLIEKIIRKAVENADLDVTYNVETYLTEITDIIGIRALYVFKNDYWDLHQRITKEYKKMFSEKPQVKLRVGDDKKIYSKLRNVEYQQDTDYRSIHYSIRYVLPGEFAPVEIQTRSIFEEGWSEINHRMLYKQPQNEHTLLLKQASSILSSLAGDCDVLAQLMKEILDYGHSSTKDESSFPVITSENKSNFIKFLEASISSGTDR